MSRPKRLDRPLRKEICIPTSVAHRVELLLTPLTRGRNHTGAWSDLITALLRQWITEQARSITIVQPQEEPTHGTATTTE